MSGHFEVLLTGFPKDRTEHMERVVHKHNRPWTHKQVHAAVARVAAGQAEVIASFVEEHAADNVVKELAYHGATGEVRSDAGSEEAAA